MCLDDENEKQYNEVCVEEEIIQREGYKTIFRGGIDGVPCSTNNYQPFSHSSTTGGSCAMVKTSCNEEGQLIYDDGSSTTDRSCRCDYRVGYDYVALPSNKCFCKPTIEDCSCYMKYCDANQVLTQDYKCAIVYKLTGVFDCPEVGELGQKDGEKNQRMFSNDTKTDYQNKEKKYHGILDVILGMAIGMIIASVVFLSAEDVYLNVMRLIYSHNVPSVSVDNELHYTDIGKPVSFFCKIYANPPCSNVVWKKYEDGQYATIHSDGIDCSQTKDFTFPLNLDRFIESDSGLYFCYATNAVGTSKSKCITLSEKTYKPTIKVDVEGNYCFNKINEDVSMPYTVSANPPCTSVVWKKIDDGICTTIYSRGIASSQSKHIKSSFKLVNLTEKQSGVYFCVATNDEGTTESQYVYLHVAKHANAEDDVFSSDEENSTVGTLPYTGRRPRYYSCPSNFASAYQPSKRRRRRLS